MLIIVGGAIYAVPIMKGRAVGDSWFAIIAMVVAIMLVAAFIRLRVTAEWRGLRVVPGRSTLILRKGREWW